MSKKENQECFVVMPIGDCDGYDNGHFNHVYEDIIKPAVLDAEFTPKRADEVKETNLIHLDILKKLIDAPIAVCDLSTRNPNVLFELGIRQAFDKPVVLIQEKGTPKIFDIAPLRYLEYSKEMKYHDVLRTQRELTDMIKATKAAEKDKTNVNSIVRLMALSAPASIPKLDNTNKEFLAFDVINSQVNELKEMMGILMMEGRKYNGRKGSIVAIEYERLLKKLDKLESFRNSKGWEPSIYEKECHMLLREAEEMMMNCDNGEDHTMFRNLCRRISRKRDEC